ncbi:MAG: ABC transporter permease [Oligoflexia bacterium]|nr:ABC transporter permease [Oligoflexia bacterium]
MNDINDFCYKCYVVFKYTFFEIIKSKVLMNVFLLGLGLLLICYIAYSFTYGVPERVVLDVGLGMLSLSSVGMAIFFGVGLISKEIENRTIYMILSRPISRKAFLLGRIMGMVGVLILNILILSVLTLVLYVFLGGSIQSLILISIFFSIIEAIIVLLIVVFFSLITNPTLSVIYTVVVYIIGHSISDTMINGFAKKSVIISSILNVYSVIFPNFNKLNLKDLILYKQYLPFTTFCGITTYGLVYMLFLIFITSIIFERKNLD